MSDTQDTFDRVIGMLHDLPDVTTSRPSTVVSVTPMLGRAQTFIVQTYRQREVGDFIFVQHIDGSGGARFVIPPSASEAIARQRETLGLTVRRKVGRRVAEERKARGERPFTRKQART